MARSWLPPLASRPVMFGLLVLFACDAGGDKLVVDTGEPADSGDSGETGDSADSGPVDVDGDGFVAEQDCDDTRLDIHPDAAEICDELDNNCNAEIDEGVTLTLFADADGDGFGDSDSPIAACAAGPGVVEDATDCDDSSATNFPNAVELCDGRDNDCDGENDEDLRVVFYIDSDGDGFGNLNGPLSACEAPEGYAANYADCDDVAAGTNPDAVESCDGVDNNCDGQTDENVTATFYADSDGDSFGDIGSIVMACEVPPGFTDDDTDCDDTDYLTYPLAPEACDLRDNSCDGVVDEGVTTTFFYDADADGFGDAAGSVQACSAPAGTVEDDTDCDDTAVETYPGAPEYCDGYQTDCNAVWSSDAGRALWTAADGSLVDVTSTFAAGSAGTPAVVALADSGTLSMCEGTWYAHISVTAADVSIVGLGDVVLSGADLGTVVSGESGDLALLGLVLADGLATEFLSDGSGTGGGAVLCRNGGLTLDSVRIRNSSADFGGGIATEDCSFDATDSYFEGNLATAQGGGLYANNWSGRFTNVELTDNAAGSEGGGVAIVDGQGTVDGATFYENSAGLGGGIWLDASRITILSSHFERNEALGGGGLFGIDLRGNVADSTFLANVSATASGGAVRLEGGALNIRDSVFQGNETGRSGGGISIDTGTISVADSTISDNIAARDGGGISASGSSVTMAGLDFSANSARNGGAISVSSGGSLTLSDSTVRDNIALYDGGGLDQRDTPTTITDCTLSGNSTTIGSGGALYLYGSQTTLQTVIFDNNAADDHGGALYHNPDTTISATSCDFSNNTPEDVYSTASGAQSSVGTGIDFACDATTGCVF